MRPARDRVSWPRKSAAAGSAKRVRRPSRAEKRTGRAMRATSAPAISTQCSTKAGSLNPAQAKAAWPTDPASRPTGPAQLRRGASSACFFFGGWFMVVIMPASRIPAKLLAWYDVHRRTLPWRAPKGKRADPYRVWLSEIMLQQTTVQAVAAYYRKFLTRWPDVKALAA